MPRIDLDVVTLKQVNNNLENDTNALTGTHFPSLKTSLSSISSNVHNASINSMLSRISGDVDTISQSINSNFQKVSDFIITQVEAYGKSEEEIVGRINNIISKIQEFNAGSNPTKNVSIFDNISNSNGKQMDYRMTYYYPGDECKSGTATASGLTTNDFVVNENGWYTYDGKLVVATAHESLKSWDKYSDSTQKTYELYDELTLTIDGKEYDAIVLDKCGAAMNSPKVDLFVVDKAHGLDTQIKVTEKKEVEAL